MRSTLESLAMPGVPDNPLFDATALRADVLTDVLRHGAQQLLTQANEAEVVSWIESHKQLVDENGHRLVVRNGHMLRRSIVTGVGPVEVTQPRVHDRRPADSVDEHGQPVARFHSKIWPPCFRKAKDMVHEIWMGPSRRDTELAFDAFIEMFEPKYPKATECLSKDRDVLLTFYDFPTERWVHIRMTNPIEPTFATVRLRHRKTKGSGSRRACLAMCSN